MKLASRGPWLGFVRALVEHLLLFVLLATIIFLLLRLLPGDPAALILGDLSSPEARAQLRAKIHWDRPLLTQYGYFLRGLSSLDLGESLRRPGVLVASRVSDALIETSKLALVSVGISSVVGVGSGILSAGPWLGKKRSWLEVGRVGIGSIPLLALAPVATYLFAARLRWVPLPGDPDAGAMGTLFSATLLAIPLSAHLGRVAHRAIEDNARLPFITVVRAKGGSVARAMMLHALAASAGPILTTIGTQFGALLGGALVLEKLFDRRGLGSLILESYTSRDLPMLEVALVAAGALFVVAQSASRSAHLLVDPRARESL